MIEKTDINYKVDMQLLLRILNFELRGKEKNDIYYTCPFHQDKKAKFKLNKKTNAVYCFECEFSAKSPIEFIQKYKNMNEWMACGYLIKIFNICDSDDENTKKKAIHSLRLNLWEYSKTVQESRLGCIKSISKNRLEKLQIMLKEMGFSNRNIKRLKLECFAGKRFMIKGTLLHIEDFIIFNEKTQTAYSANYKNYSAEMLREYQKCFKGA